MVRRVLPILVGLIPAVALIGWLVIAQLPAWRVPQPGWFAVGTPGVCTAVGSLRANQGLLTGEPPLDPASARVAAEEAVGAAVDAAGWVYGSPIAVQATFDGVKRAAWLVTARVESESIAPAALVYVDGETGQVLSLAVGLDDPAARCDFNYRRAIRDAVLSPPFLLLVGYTGLLIILGLAFGVMRWRERRAKRKGV